MWQEKQEEENLPPWRIVGNQQFRDSKNIQKDKRGIDYSSQLQQYQQKWLKNWYQNYNHNI